MQSMEPLKSKIMCDVLDTIEEILEEVEDTLYNAGLYDIEDIIRYSTYQYVLRRHIDDIKTSAEPPLIILEKERDLYIKHPAVVMKDYAVEALNWVIYNIS